MKKLLLSFVFLFFCFNLSAQEHLDCGNHHESIEDEIERNKLLEEIKTTISKKSTADAITYIAIKPHLFGLDDGTGFANETAINAGLAYLNRDYKPMNVEFYFAGTSFNYYPNTKFYNFTQTASESDNFHNTNGVKNAINLYLYNKVISNGIEVAGFSSIAPTRQFQNRMSIANKYINRSAVVTHEVGHYLSLVHTFNNSNNSDVLKRELVTRNTLETKPRLSANCSNTGDFLCDTPSDPYGIKDFHKNCSYTETMVDANNDLFNPMLDNVMSYYVYCKQNLITTGQFDRMKNGVLIVTNTRKDFTLDAPETTQNAPSNLVATNLGGDYTGKIELKWKDNSTVETGYIIERAENASGPFTAVTGVKANSTSVTISTEAKKTYYFRIKPSNSKNNYSAVSNVVKISGLCANTTKQPCKVVDDETKPAYRIEEVILKKGASTILSNLKSGCSEGGIGNYFNSISASIAPNDKIDFTIRTKNVDRSGYYFFTQIYADWNKDSDFSDTNEKLFSNETRTLLEAKGSFTIPSNIAPGSYRLRVVISSYTSQPTACNAIFGEIEDYKLTYATLDTPQFNAEKTVYCYPNPTLNILNIQTPDDVNIEKVIIHDINSRKVIDQKLENAQINVENLSSGIYFIEIFTNETTYQSRFIKM